MALQHRPPRRLNADASVCNPSAVYLNVYDLKSSLTKANRVLKYVGTGIFHAGVEVYGVEYSYGGSDESDSEDEGSGLFENEEPRQHPVHVFKQSVPMGETRLTQDEVTDLLEELADQWLAQEYDVLNHNCTDFSAECCKRLGVGPFPGWVKSAAGLGANARDLVPDLRGRGKRLRNGTEDDKLVVGDLTLGVLGSCSDRLQHFVDKGKSVRCGGEGDGYHFGDLSRGLMKCGKGKIKKALAEGRAARDAPPDANYSFGDLSRGLLADFARK
eukprot:CAMPEP_0172680336 /NCGR_PEP_ID=MMETSP1074-20121228/16701_1 /TAXON_ID=2916 /ORGANISM="Ceratium fusus, Strain PA161109" /LENGTH=271 /DNA_ID=CAMNT_0013498655 /DNA_START=87 /DNA_END=902 /DNA_ORIENTATION=-